MSPEFDDMTEPYKWRMANGHVLLLKFPFGWGFYSYRDFIWHTWSSGGHSSTWYSFRKRENMRPHVMQGYWLGGSHLPEWYFNPMLFTRKQQSDELTK